ncbi:Sodium bicarbonate cotransporter 3 [Sparganum proliferum]
MPEVQQASEPADGSTKEKPPDGNEPGSGVLVDSEAYHQDSGENKPRKHQKAKKEHGLGISQSPHQHHHHPHHHHHQHQHQKKKGQKYWFQSRLKKTAPSEGGAHATFVLGERPVAEATAEEENRLIPAFVQLSVLCSDPSLQNPPEWREVARWIKFEEEVEEYADRWSKPHVAVQSLMSVFEVRSCLAKAVMLLDLEATTLESICETVCERLVRKKQLASDLMEQTKNLLHLHHSTIYSRQKRQKGAQQLHLIRSLAEIGKRQSAKEVTKMSHVPSRTLIKSATNLGVNRLDAAAATTADASAAGAASTPSPENEPTSPLPYDHHFFKKVPHGAEAVNILVGETDFLPHPVVAFVRLKEATSLGEMTEVPVPTRFIFMLFGTQGNGHKYEQIGRAVFHDFALRSTSKTDLLAGIDEFLSASLLLPPSQWDPKSRIDPPPTAPSEESRRQLAAPSVGTSVSSRPRNQHHHSHQETDGTAGLLTTTVVPTVQSAAHGDSGSEQPSHSVDIEAARSGGTGGGGGAGGGGAGGGNGSQTTEEAVDRNNNPALMRTGRLFGGLVADLKRRAPHYLSDFTDAIHIQCFASFFFLYFACLAPIITFGGLLSTVTGGYLGTMESIVSGAVVGILYALFSGQPLTIMGSTGPVLVFESIIYRLCTNNRWAYLSFRFWIGMWTSFLLLIMVAFDLSALVRFITRFTEESFALLIALIFIVEAFQKTLSISKVYPVNLNWSPAVFPPMDCRCIPPANITNQQNLDQARHDHPMLDLPFIGTNDTDAHHPSNINSTTDWERITSDLYTWDALETQKRCHILKGVWNNKACEAFYAPDVFFFCCLLFLSCFLLSYALRSIRTSRFFPSRIRSLIADFAVMIAIIICTLVDYFCGLHTPKLQVPTEFEPTLGYGKRGWLIPPFNGNPWWSSLLALGPALLAVILIFMDQQITAVIINRRENKLKKGEGYHLDLLIVAITLATNSLLGIPWFVAATVLSINHVLSLKKVSESAAPGEQPVFLGCREQRVTGFLIFLFIGLSVFMSHILRLIPMAVLYGVFLLMGITSLNGLQFIQRCLLIFMPGKYQPDYPYLSHVRLWRVHLFTIIQLVCLVLLWVIKSIHQVSILFPLMVLAMCFIRKGLDFIFTQHEMHWLDDVLPESSCSRKSKKTAPDFNSKTTIDSPPISEPLLLKPDDRPFSVSEEVSKTLIWRQLSGIGLVEQGDDDSEDVKKTTSSRQTRLPERGHRRRRKGNRDATDDGGDSAREHASRAKRRHSHGNRLRVLRLFSADANAGIGTEIPVLYRNTTDSDIAQTATDDGGSISGGGRKFNAGCTQSNNSALATDHLTPPVIQINPPSSQCSPNSSRRNSRL